MGKERRVDVVVGRARLSVSLIKRRAHSLTDEQKLFLDECVKCVEEDIPSSLKGEEGLDSGEGN